MTDYDAYEDTTRTVSDSNTIYFDNDDYVYTNTKEALHRGKNINDLIGARADVFMLFNNRHEPPKYMTPLTPMFLGYYNPLDFETLRERAEKVIAECGPTIYLFVTGCTPATVACINTAIKYNKNLWLCHYDCSVKGYKRQKAVTAEHVIAQPVLAATRKPSVFRVTYTLYVNYTPNYMYDVNYTPGCVRNTPLFVRAKSSMNAIEIAQQYICDMFKDSRDWSISKQGNNSGTLALRNIRNNFEFCSYSGWNAFPESDDDHVIG